MTICWYCDAQYSLVVTYSIWRGFSVRYTLHIFHCRDRPWNNDGKNQKLKSISYENYLIHSYAYFLQLSDMIENILQPVSNFVCFFDLWFDLILLEMYYTYCKNFSTPWKIWLLGSRPYTGICCNSAYFEHVMNTKNKSTHIWSLFHAVSYFGVIGP